MRAAWMRSTIMAGSALLPAVCWTLAVCLLLSAAGCSKPAGKKVKKDAVDGVAVEEEGEPLPEGVDLDTALAVDEGRIRVCGPTGWSRAAQSKDYLVKYIPGRRKTYPSIVVMAVAAPDGFTEVGADEHRPFVTAIAESLAATFSKNGKSTLLKKPAAVKLGPHFGATWSAPATIKVDGIKESIDRSSYAVVLGGRMYTVEIRAPKGKLDDTGRQAAKAVASALDAPELGAEPAQPAEAAEPAAAAATEEAPAESATESAKESAALPAGS